MTTIPFLPSTTAAPPFQATVQLDGSTYGLFTVSNFYRSDWYVGLVNQSNVLVIFQPLIGSPPGGSIALFPGLFQTSTIIYTPSSGNFTVSP